MATAAQAVSEIPEKSLVFRIGEVSCLTATKAFCPALLGVGISHARAGEELPAGICLSIAAKTGRPFSKSSACSTKKDSRIAGARENISERPAERTSPRASGSVLLTCGGTGKSSYELLRPKRGPQRVANVLNLHRARIANFCSICTRNISFAVLTLLERE